MQEIFELIGRVVFEFVLSIVFRMPGLVLFKAFRRDTEVQGDGSLVSIVSLMFWCIAGGVVWTLFW